MMLLENEKDEKDEKDNGNVLNGSIRLAIWFQFTIYSRKRTLFEILANIISASLLDHLMGMLPLL
jgi:hypothetical protein